MHEVCSVCKLVCHHHTVVMLTSRKRTGTERKTIVLVWYGIEHPLNIFSFSNDSWKSEDRVRRIVRMHTHVYVVLIADRHDSLKPVFHVLLKMLLVNAIVKLQQVTELLNRSLVTLFEVTRDKALRLYDDVLNELMVLLWSGGRLHLVCLCNEVPTPM